MRGRDLATTFGAIVSAVTVCACSSSNDAATNLPLATVCPTHDPSEFAPFTVAPGVDGIFIYSQNNVSLPDGGFGAAVPYATIGAPCSTATDHDDCAARANAASASSAGWQWGFGGNSTREALQAVSTAGDTVTPLTLDAFRTAVAPIDTPNEATALAFFYGDLISCGPSNAAVDGDGFRLRSDTGGCGGPFYEYIYRVARDGTIAQLSQTKLGDGDTSCVEGRRPEGYVAEDRPWLETLPAHLAEIAHMEAAAVIAFEDLHAALVGVNAPVALRERADRARKDEIAHAAIFMRLARAHGAEPPRVDRRSPPPPTLLSLALDNATEGCVREVYGAVVAAYQAKHAGAAFTSAFERIARDEAGHAELSLDLAVWLDAALPAEDRTAVAAAREKAWDDLARVVAVTEPSEEVRRDAGMPTAATALRLLSALKTSLLGSLSGAA